MLKEYIKKNKKSVIAATIIFAILHIGCLIPFIYVGIKAAWDVYIYLDNVVIFGVVLLCITLVYRESKINRIRKKTKNWVDPLKEEEKAQYKKIVNPVLYETVMTIIVYFVVATIDYSIWG